MTNPSQPALDLVSAKLEECFQGYAESKSEEQGISPDVKEAAHGLIAMCEIHDSMTISDDLAIKALAEAAACCIAEIHKIQRGTRYDRVNCQLPSIPQ